MSNHEQAKIFQSKLKACFDFSQWIFFTFWSICNEAGGSEVNTEFRSISTSTSIMFQIDRSYMDNSGQNNNKNTVTALDNKLTISLKPQQKHLE